MKLKTLYLLVIFFLLSFKMTHASFPVSRTSSIETINQKEKKEDLFTPLLSSRKSQGITLILALTLGLVAAHRWYVGCHWFINLFFIFSLGGCGVWLFLDIVRISLGKFNPKGRFKKGFF